jgi:hypothetical protein
VSRPFINLVRERSKGTPDDRLVEQAFSRMTRWSQQSGSKMVSLDEVAWLAAVLLKGAVQSGQYPHMAESKDENGARVVTATMDDGVSMQDGAG